VFSRLLSGLGLIAVIIALASAQSISDLEAQLAAAKEKQAEEAASAQPEIAVEAGNLHIRVGKNSDAHFERLITESANAFDLADAVDSLVTRMEAMEAKQVATLAPVPGSLNTLSASLKTASASIARIDDSVKAMQDVDKKVDSIPGQVDSQIDSVKAKMEKLVSDMAKLSKSVSDANTKAIDNVNTKVADAKTQNTAALATLSSVIDKNVKATTEVIGNAGTVESVYINWGSNKCEGDNVKTVWGGVMYASYHDQHGGTTPQCLKNEAGNMGGQAGGWDGLDRLFPVNLDHCSGTKLQDVGHCNKNVPCSLCQRKTHCYLESSTDECSAKGYVKQYVGWMYGSHTSHNARTERTCISEAGSGWGLNNGNGAYMYPTLNNHGMSQRQGDQTIKCQWCCDDA